MKKTFMILAVVFACTLCLQTNAHATFAWDWSLEARDYYVDPGDTIFFNATLTNLSDQEEVITRASFNSNWGFACTNWGGGLNIANYVSTFVGLLVDSENNPIDINLAPGNSIDFEYGWWLIGDNIPGTYTGSYLGLNLIHSSIQDGNYGKLWYFDVHVGDSQNPDPVVPEPTTMLLLGFGLIGVAGFKRKQ